MVYSGELNSLSTEPERIAVDESVGGQQKIDIFLESILNWTQEIFGSDQIIKAKEEFYSKNGKVFHDDIIFNNRMAYFVDFFIFQRPLETSDDVFSFQTPFQAFCLEGPGKGRVFVLQYRLSLYKILRIKKSEIVLKDLFLDKKLAVTVLSKMSCRGLQKGDYFQGFVYTSTEGKILSKGLIFHPFDVIGIIKSRIKKIGKEDHWEHLRVLSLLAKQQLRHFRHSHVHPKVIYDQLP